MVLIFGGHLKGVKGYKTINLWSDQNEVFISNSAIALVWFWSAIFVSRQVMTSSEDRQYTREWGILWKDVQMDFVYF